MRVFSKLLLAVTVSLLSAMSLTAERPWTHGRLTTSSDGHYLCHADGEPFFWLGDTGWLMPERLNRDEVAYYLGRCGEAGFNVVQVQVINAVPAVNVYGQLSHPAGYDFTNVDREGVYGYWNHLDYIVKTAEQNGIYVGMVCIWGGLVKAGLMSVAEAEAYGRFLAERYKDSPNIVWIIGGDIRGDVKTESWLALAETIKSIDSEHLMTFHPFGRTSSARWFNDASWLDFNMFQSGHRRYDQTRGDGDNLAEASVAEDNWRYVDEGRALMPVKPILDAEPSYEDIPQGLHDTTEPRWTAADVRRYAYWSVFAGACGHTYGHNSVMQMYRQGLPPAYGASTTWYDALDAPGRNQMRFLKELILKFPYFERIPSQDVIVGETGSRYERLIATRGSDYLLVYNYTGRAMTVNLDKIAGKTKSVWVLNAKTGEYVSLGDVRTVNSYTPKIPATVDGDFVLIAFDSTKKYLR
jgi:hypothetical protein